MTRLVRPSLVERSQLAEHSWPPPIAEIGSKGVSLSGGQKARVALARAIYSRAKVRLATVSESYKIDSAR